jgi:hypothetical protein
VAVASSRERVGLKTGEVRLQMMLMFDRHERGRRLRKFISEDFGKILADILLEIVLKKLVLRKESEVDHSLTVLRIDLRHLQLRVGREDVPAIEDEVGTHFRT